ncbi:MAG: ABC-2 family transporter protein [Leptospiraceae bacterium]|nr:ABC-2 family transporter protein [Leptospiraceae bacterium]
MNSTQTKNIREENTLSETIYIYLRIATASIKSRMEYRASFLIFLFTLLTFYAAQISTIGIVITRFKTIGGWSMGEMAFLYSLLILSQGIVTFIFSGILEFSNHVREGTFDRFLVRPLHPLLQVIMGGFEITGFAHIILGFLTFFMANSLIEVHWNLANAFVFVAVVIGGALILGSIRIIIAAIAFYAVNTNSLVHLFVFSSREFLLYPLNIYSSGLKFLLTFIVPLAFINFYPAHYFLNKSGENLFHPMFVFGTLPIGIVMILFSLWFWHKGQNAYESAGG